MSHPSVFAVFQESINSDERSVRVFWLLILLFLAFLGSYRLITTIEADQKFGTTDFRQDYTLACCSWNSCNPYDRSEGRDNICPSMHISPHPLSIGIILVPLAWLPFPSALAIWNLINGIGLALLCIVPLKKLGVRPLTAYSIAALSCCAIAHPPWTALVLGQIGILEASFGLGAALLLGSGHLSLAGIVIGLLFCLKFAGIPILLYLALRFRKSFYSAGLTALSIQLMAVLTFGWEVLMTYLFDELPQASLVHGSRVLNQSISFWGSRLFSGVNLEAGSGRFFDPLFSAPSLAGPVTIALLAATAVIAVKCATRIPNHFLAIIWLLGIDAIFLPVRWEHVGVVLLPTILALITLIPRKRVDFGTECCLIVFLMGFCFGGWLNQLYYTQIKDPSFLSATVALAHQFSVLGLLSISARVFAETEQLFTNTANCDIGDDLRT